MAKKSYTALLQDFNDAAIGEPETMVQQPVSAEYEKDIEAIRSGVIDKYHDEIKDLIGKDEHRKTLLGYVETVVREKFPQYAAKDYLERIYQDIFEFAFINKYLNDPDFEEMNGNSWNDIEVVTSKGYYKIPESFNSPEHARNTIRKMMQVGGAVLDEAEPTLDSFIGTGLRLTASISPVVDEEAGVVFSLRKLSGKMISKADLVEKYDSYSSEEIEFLDMCLRHGISVLFGGATSSGKSSDMQTILHDIFAEGKLRGYIIEENTRELDFVVRDENGRTISRVVHTKTREAKNSNTLDVDSDLLVKTSLRFHPNIIVPAEMRGKEAMSAVEAALTGHTVASSAHVQSVTKAYERILMLCQKANNNITEDMLMSIIVEAFPVVVFKQQLEDKSRRCMRIFEATGYNKREQMIEGHIVFQFFKSEESTAEKVIGFHRQVSSISPRLCQKLFENGCEMNLINKYNPSFNMRSNMQGNKDFIEKFINVDAN